MDKSTLDKIKQGIRFETYPPQRTGGQTVGLAPRGIKLIHDDLNFEVTSCQERSQQANREIAILLFELYLTTL